MKSITKIFSKIKNCRACQAVRKNPGHAVASLLFVFAFFALCFSLRGSLQAQRAKLMTAAAAADSSFYEPAFANYQQQEILDSPAAKTQSAKIFARNATHYPGFDGSEVTTSYDAYGSKTEMRSFHSNERIFMVVVETTPDNVKIAHAYSRTGERRELPKSLIASALTDSANQLADAVNFYAPVRLPVAPVAEQLLTVKDAHEKEHSLDSNNLPEFVQESVDAANEETVPKIDQSTENNAVSPEAAKSKSMLSQQ